MNCTIQPQDIDKFKFVNLKICHDRTLADGKIVI